MELQNASGITPSTIDQSSHDTGSASVDSATARTSPASVMPLTQALVAGRPRHSAFSEILAEIA